MKPSGETPGATFARPAIVTTTGCGGAGGVGGAGGGASRTSRAEARAALSELGYATDEIRGALDGLRDDVGVEEMLRLALRELASR